MLSVWRFSGDYLHTAKVLLVRDKDTIESLSANNCELSFEYLYVNPCPSSPFSCRSPIQSFLNLEFHMPENKDI